MFYTQNYGIRQEAVERAPREEFVWTESTEDGGGRRLWEQFNFPCFYG